MLLLLTLTTGAHALVMENHFNQKTIASTLSNPAHLNLGQEKVGLSLGSTADIALNSWSFALLNQFGTKELDEIDKEIILQATNSENIRLTTSAQPYIGVNYGNFGLRMNGQVHGQAQIPSDVLDLILMGNELNKEYTFDNLNGEGAGYLEAAIMLAIPLDDQVDLPYVSALTLGIGAKYHQGLVFGQFEGNGTLESILNDNDALIKSAGDATYIYSRNGSGISFDFGLSADLSQQWKFDASVLNLGTMTWRNVQEGTASFTGTVDMTDLENAQFDYTMHDPKETSDISWKIPQIWRLATSHQATEELTILGELSWRKSNVLGWTATQVIGAEYSPWDFLPLQATLIKQTKTPIRLDLGMGLKFKHAEFNLNLVNASGLLFSKTHGVGLGLNFNIYF